MSAEHRDEACERAYRDFAPDVYRVAYGILRNEDEAVDATNDAFARAWERWDQYDDQRPVRPWLHGIVVHVAFDRLRRRRVRALIASAATFVTDASTPPPDLAAEIVQRRVIEQAMADLRPQARAALVLRHYYGYEYAQIGEFLRMSSGSVGSLLSRAHAALRERLADTFSSTRLVRAARTDRPPYPEPDPVVKPPEATP